MNISINKDIEKYQESVVAIPVVAPLALNGFYSYQGMSFTQMFKRKLWFAFKNRPLTYISEESEKIIKRMRMEEERQRKKEDKRKNRRSNKNRK